MKGLVRTSRPVVLLSLHDNSNDKCKNIVALGGILLRHSYYGVS